MADQDSKYEVLSRKEAIERGLSHYFTGQPCRHGHLALRRTKGNCVDCEKEYGREWRRKNPELRLEKLRKWREKNPEKDKAISVAYRRNNPEKFREYRKRHYDKNPEKSRQRSRDWRENNRELHLELSRQRAARFRKNFPEKVRITNRNRDAKKRSSGRHTLQEIETIFAAQKGRCAYCRKKLGKDYEVDHIIPLAKNGSNSKENLQVVCRPCNSRKQARDPLEFARMLGKLL